MFYKTRKRQQDSVKSSLIARSLTILFVAIVSVSSKSQSRDAAADASPLLRVDSTFVWVPALVKTENGGTLSDIDVSRFHLVDNGNPEKVTEINTDGLPVSLVILMQTGGAAGHFLSNYADLPELIGRFAGGSVHEITLVTFDSRVEEIWPFPARTDGLSYALTHQQPGNKGAAIIDAVAIAVRQLEGEPGRFRRVVLLLSQGRDVGSSISPRSLVEHLGTSSTVVYSLTFPGGEMDAGRVRKARHASGMDGVLERTSRALSDHTAGEIAALTGGSDFRFDDQRGFNSAMLEAISDFHNGITLGFQPSHHIVGFHHIDIQVNPSRLQVTARRAYWWTPPK